MMSKLRNGLALLAPLCLLGCTDAPFLIANLPTLLSSTTVRRDLAYGREQTQTLDLYIPKTTSKTVLPVIVFFYGGRWTEGGKSLYRFAADALAKQGFIVAVPDYRKYPQVKFPAFVEDGAAVVAWVHDNIAAHGGGPERIFLAGHSAGAHIGALIAADPHYLQAHRKSRSVVKGFAGLAGPYAFVPEDEDLKDMFGPPERYPQMQAPTFIDGGQPPMLLLHGRDDTSVRLYNQDRLAAAIAAKGGKVETAVYPGIDHIEILGALTVFWRYKAPVKADMMRFFREEAAALDAGRTDIETRQE
jgi:acetyl esterase/lipase